MKTDLSQLNQNSKQVLKKISEVARPKKTPGRKPKKPEELQTERAVVTLTIAEKEKLLALSQEKGNLPLTILIRNILKENGAI